MKNLLFLIAFLLIISCNLGGNKLVSNDTISTKKNVQIDKEQEYLRIRDSYVEQFSKQINSATGDSLNKLDEAALKDLENRLIDILKDSRFSSQGKINMVTLQPYADFGLLDGLSFLQDSVKIFYTTKKIFLHYFLKDQNFQIGTVTPGILEEIFTAAYITDAWEYNLSSFKLDSNKDIQAYGMIGAGANGSGAILADNLYVFVSIGNYIYMAEKGISNFKAIEKCVTRWDSLSNDLEKQRKESDYINTRNNEGKDIVVVAMDKYCECYQKELIKDSQFRILKKQIENIAKYLYH